MVSIGISAWYTTSGTAWRDGARRFEGEGYDTLWVADHVGMLDPFPALVAAAAVTERLRIGTYVLNAEFWNPLLLARVAATTDLVTDGRLVLGIGAGHAQEEFEQAGLRYPPPGERVGRLEALVPALRRLLAGETVDAPALGLAGAATGLPASSAPLLVGGNGDRVLDLAGREGDVAGLVGFTSGTGKTHADLSHWGWDGLADRLGRVRAAASAAGRSPEAGPRIDVLVQRAAVTDDPRSALADFSDEGVPDEMFDSPFLLVGSVGEIAERLARLDEMGIDGITVFGRDADTFAPFLAAR